MTGWEVFFLISMFAGSNYLSYEYGKNTQGYTTQNLLAAMGNEQKRQAQMLADLQIEKAELERQLEEANDTFETNLNAVADPCLDRKPHTSRLILDSWREFVAEEPTRVPSKP